MMRRSRKNVRAAQRGEIWSDRLIREKTPYRPPPPPPTWLRCGCATEERTWLTREGVSSPTTFELAPPSSVYSAYLEGRCVPGYTT
eukprot:750192-Hanusia_phi.AAC.3